MYRRTGFKAATIKRVRSRRKMFSRRSTRGASSSTTSSSNPSPPTSSLRSEACRRSLLARSSSRVSFPVSHYFCRRCCGQPDACSNDKDRRDHCCRTISGRRTGSGAGRRARAEAASSLSSDVFVTPGSDCAPTSLALFISLSVTGRTERLFADKSPNALR
jgi:hypothetical protein